MRDAKRPMANDINTSFTAESAQGLSGKAITVGTAALVVWVFLFAGGILIASAPFREKLNSQTVMSLIEMIKTWAVVITSWTVTNVAILCCLSSLLGGFYRQCAKRQIPKQSDSHTTEVRFFPYLIQGFVVYLLLLSGLLLLGEAPFQVLSQDKYIRLASSASLFSFLVGYDPRIFIRLLERIEQVTEGKSKPPP